MKGTRLHDRHRIHLDVVDNGLPLLPHVPVFHPVPALAGLVHFEVFVLDVVDVCVSKVKRFSAHDRDDILAMVERGLVAPASLARRFADAIEDYTGPAEEEDFLRYNANLHRVQRDMLGVEASGSSPPRVDGGPLLSGRGAPRRGSQPRRAHRAALYTDLVLASANAAARTILQALMATKTYQYQSDFAKAYVAQGEARALLHVLKARGIRGARARARAHHDLHRTSRCSTAGARKGPATAKSRNRRRRRVAIPGSGPDHYREWGAWRIRSLRVSDIYRGANWKLVSDGEVPDDMADWEIQPCTVFTAAEDWVVYSALYVSGDERVRAAVVVKEVGSGGFMG